MGHLSCVIKQNLIDFKCRKSLPLRTQEKYKHKNVDCTTTVYPWKSYVILLYEILVYLRNIFQIRIMLPVSYVGLQNHITT